MPPLDAIPKELRKEKNNSDVSDITPAELAHTGYNLYWACVEEPHLPWDKYEGKALWEQAAARLATTIRKAIESEDVLRVSSLAMDLWQLANNPEPFNSAPKKVQIAYEIVCRHWVSCMHSAGFDIDVAAFERDHLMLFKRKMAEMPVNKINGSAASLFPKTITPTHEQLAVINNEVQSAPLQDQLAELQKAAEPYLEPPYFPKPKTGVINGFRSVIDIKIAEHERKLAALRTLRSTINESCDEALWEIFKEVLTKE